MMSKKQKQLISNYFKSSKSTELCVKAGSPSKRTRLNLNSLSSPSSSSVNNEETTTSIGSETVAIIDSLSTNNFSRSLNFSTHLMELDGSTEGIPQRGTKTSAKLTKLEEQVIKLKDDNPGLVLAIEVNMFRVEFILIS